MRVPHMRDRRTAAAMSMARDGAAESTNALISTPSASATAPTLQVISTAPTAGVAEGDTAPSSAPSISLSTTGETSSETPCIVRGPLAGRKRADVFRFAGRMVGKAMQLDQPSAARLTRPLLKHLIGWPVGTDDIEFVDYERFNSLKQLRCAFFPVSLSLLSRSPSLLAAHVRLVSLVDAKFRARRVSCAGMYLTRTSHSFFRSLSRSTLDEDAVEDMYLDLSVMYTDSVTEKTHVLELRPGGSQLDVNTENVDEYIELVTRWTMLDRITDDVGAFIGGVCVGAPRIVETLRPRLLHLLLLLLLLLMSLMSVLLHYA